MISKKTFLSIEDKVKLDDIYKNGTRNVDIISFLIHLEKIYNLEDFNYDRFSVTKIYDRDYNAAEAYHFCLMSVLYSGNDYVVNNSKQIVPIVNKQIRRIERAMKSGAEKSFCLQSIMQIMILLLKIYTYYDDLYNLTKTYYKFFELHSSLLEYDEGGALTHEISIAEEFYSDVFAKYIFGPDFRYFLNNADLMKCFNTALHYSTDDEPCLVIGETGTGKELVARAIHNNSHRMKNNFCAVNCGGFTESLFNSEIAGIIKGAATGVETRLGAFLKACGREENGKTVGGYDFISGKRKIQFIINGKDIERDPTPKERYEFGGTLFLDEVNSMPIELQAKLLRIIQQKEVQVIGEDRTRKFDLKIICASNTDLVDDIQKATFREDFYYRISRGKIKLPPLRDMKESIVGLSCNRIAEISKQIGHKNMVRITKGAADKLKSYNWPGNIRELENVLYRALKNMILENNNTLKPHHIEDLKNKEESLKDLERCFLGKTHAEIEKLYVEYKLN